MTREQDIVSVRKVLLTYGGAHAAFERIAAARYAEADALLADLAGRPITERQTTNPHAITPAEVASLLERTGLRCWRVRLDGTRLAIDPPPQAEPITVSTGWKTEPSNPMDDIREAAERVRNAPPHPPRFACSDCEDTGLRPCAVYTRPCHCAAGKRRVPQ